MVLELLLPERMNEVALKIIWRMFDQRCVTSLFADLRVALAQSIQSLLFLGLYN